MSLVAQQGPLIHSAPRILLRIEDRILVALLDTGASRSFIQRAIASSPLQPSTVRVRIADGSLIAPSACQELRVSLGGEIIRHRFQVLGQIPEETILGMDFMALYEVSIHPTKAYARVGPAGQILPFLTKSNPPHIVRNVHDISIPARCQRFVEVTSDTPSGLTYLIEGIEESECIRGVYVGRSFHERKPSQILVMNPMEKPCRIPRGASLGICTPAERVQRSTIRTDPQIQFELGDTLTRPQQRKILALLSAYEHRVFASPDRPFGKTTAGEHHIDVLPGTRPIAQRLRPTSPADKRVVRDEISKMAKYGVIRPSSSAWASPIVLVKKKDGAIRFCVDFRRLNDVTVKDVFPLPRTSDMLESFEGARIFSTLDAAAGYWQVPLTEEAVEKTAFISSEGLFEFLVMPFGLCNAPATFQRIMNVLLAGLNGLSCLVYLDDIIVFSKDFDQHCQDLRAVLDRLVDAQILLKPSKCRFGVRQVEYLGHIVSAVGISPDPRKIERLKNFPTPKSITDVRAFLGFAGYYRRFILNFAMIAAPLFELLKSEQNFKWEPAQQHAFETLIASISSNAVLAHPQFGKPFLVDADASGTGIGGILSQVVDRKERPIAFVSRHLTDAEQKWHIREKEALAIIYALESFRHFLQGSEFVVRTDHSSLQWLLTAKSGRLQRWALRLMEFGPYKIIHRSGKDHTNVDALSRAIPRSEAFPDKATCSFAHTIIELPTRDELIKAQVRDPQIIEALKRVNDPASPFLLIDGLVGISTPKGPRLFIPESLRERFVRCYHENPLHGHFGINKTLKKLRERYHIPKGHRVVRDILRGCVPCLRRKEPSKHHVNLVAKPSSRPWSTVAADFCGPYAEGSGGKRYILVIIDHFTKWVELIPTKTQQAQEVAQAFYDRIICHFGCPRRFLSDRGQSFKATIIDALCGLFHIKKIFSSSYFPQGDGTAERFMRSLNTSLSILSRHHPANWPKFVNGIAFAYNTCVHAATGETPFYLNTGRVASFPEEGWIRDWATVPPDESSYQEYVQNLRETIDHAKAHARRCLELSWLSNSRKYKQDASNIQVGDKVLIRLAEWERNMFPIQKLAPHWSNPATVEERMTNTKTFKVRKDNNEVVSVNLERLVRLPSHARMDEGKYHTEEQVETK